MEFIFICTGNILLTQLGTASQLRGEEQLGSSSKSSFEELISEGAPCAEPKDLKVERVAVDRICSLNPQPTEAIALLVIMGIPESVTEDLTLSTF